MTNNGNPSDDGKKPTGDYTVGYGKPPKKSQFKPGRSGNPKGQRKKAKEPESDRALLERVLNEDIEVRENGRSVRLSKFEAIIRQLASKAIKGDLRATKMVIECGGKLVLSDRTADGEQRWGVLLVSGMAADEAEFMERHGDKRTPTEPLTAQQKE